jgi:hypothetical protein
MTDAHHVLHSPERRSAASAQIHHIDARLAVVEKALTHITSELKANTETTNQVRDMLDAARGAWKVLDALGKLTKVLGVIAGAGAAVYTAVYMLFHHGRGPGT